jgi:hypothetical protein
LANYLTRIDQSAICFSTAVVSYPELSKARTDIVLIPAPKLSNAFSGIDRRFLSQFTGELFVAICTILSEHLNLEKYI